MTSGPSEPPGRGTRGRSPRARLDSTGGTFVTRLGTLGSAPYLLPLLPGTPGLCEAGTLGCRWPANASAWVTPQPVCTWPARTPSCQLRGLQARQPSGAGQASLVAPGTVACSFPGRPRTQHGWAVRVAAAARWAVGTVGVLAVLWESVSKETTTAGTRYSFCVIGTGHRDRTLGGGPSARGPSPSQRA